jgi:hypothetical protein
MREAGRPPVLAELKGTRISVIATDRLHAIQVAQSKTWWTRVQNRTHPVPERGRWWFVLADEPLSGLEEFARTARKAEK